MASQILVTDATSFVSSHIIKQLQAEGHQVRGSVCSLSDEEERVKKLLEELNTEDAKYKIEVVEADTAKGDAWEIAVKDVQYVIHNVKAAAAVPSTTEGEAPSQPAVDAVLNVFKACLAAKSVSRVILTSSHQAIAAAPTAGTEKVYKEEDWADAETADPLTKSIILAEKAAWDFVKELTDADKIELVVINPTLPVGPALLDVQQDVVKLLMDRGINGCPRVNYSLVDVRDLATAHVKALTLAEAAGNRLIVHGANLWMREIAQTLAKEFKSQGYGVPTVGLPGFALWGLSLFNKTAKSFIPLVGKQSQFDNTKMKEVVGIEPMDVKESVIEEAQVLIDRGLVKKNKKVKNNTGAAAPATDGAAEGGENKAEDEVAAEKKEDGEEKPAENGDVKEDGKEKEVTDEKAGGDTAGETVEKKEESEEVKKDEEAAGEAKKEEESKAQEKPAEEAAAAPSEEAKAE